MQRELAEGHGPFTGRGAGGGQVGQGVTRRTPPPRQRPWPEVSDLADAIVHGSAGEEIDNAPDGREDVLCGLDGAQAEEHIGAGCWEGRGDAQGDRLGNGAGVKRW